jgi:hypothetical protein
MTDDETKDDVALEQTYGNEFVEQALDTGTRCHPNVKSYFDAVSARAQPA